MSRRYDPIRVKSLGVIHHLSWDPDQNTGIGYCCHSTSGLFHQRLYLIHGDFFNTNGSTDRIAQCGDHYNSDSV